MEKMDKFVYQPDLTILRGIKVKKDTKLHFEKKLESPEQEVTQDVENLRVKTLIITRQDNTLIKGETITDLLEGDILIFDENYGYFQPQNKVGTVDDALETIKAQKSVIERSEKEYEEKEGKVDESETK